jgi:uncharacterized cupredoxin-like copper-binding protein
MQNFYRRGLHWGLQLVMILTLSVALAACGGSRDREARSNSEMNTPVAAAEQPSETANQSGTVVNVVAQDFKFLLDASSAPAGPVTFVVANEGSMPHDFAITIDGERYKTSMIQPGSSDSLTVELQPGSYEYVCTVPGHDILGMKGTFSVE